MPQIRRPNQASRHPLAPRDIARNLRMIHRFRLSKPFKLRVGIEPSCAQRQATSHPKIDDKSPESFLDAMDHFLYAAHSRAIAFGDVSVNSIDGMEGGLSGICTAIEGLLNEKRRWVSTLLQN